jgi:hypothetical protein
MAQDRLIDAARSVSGCFVLSVFHHLLKVLRYRVLGSGTFASLSSRDCTLTFTSEVWVAIHFSDASLCNEAATKMDDGLAARFFSWKHFLNLLVAIDLANNASASRGDAAFHIWQTVLAAYWFFVLGACIHLVISGELAPEERVQVVEFGLATALTTFLQRSEAPLERALETRRGGDAWAAPIETLQKYLVTKFVFIVELSRIAHPIRGSVLGTMPAAHWLSLARRLCDTDQRAEALENSFEWSILRALCRSRLGVPARLDRGRKRELCEDVTFQPLPVAFVHAPFGSVMAQVRGAMGAMGVPLLPIGLPERDEGLALFLQDVVTPPEPAPRGAITTRNERFVSTAALNQRRYWASGRRQIAGDGAG